MWDRIFRRPHTSVSSVVPGNEAATVGKPHNRAFRPPDIYHLLRVRVYGHVRVRVWCAIMISGAFLPPEICPMVRVMV